MKKEKGTRVGDHIPTTAQNDHQSVQQRIMIINPFHDLRGDYFLNIVVVNVFEKCTSIWGGYSG